MAKYKLDNLERFWFGQQKAKAIRACGFGGTRKLHKQQPTEFQLGWQQCPNQHLNLYKRFFYLECSFMQVLTTSGGSRLFTGDFNGFNQLYTT